MVDYPILQGRVREMELQLETVRRQHEGERAQLKNKIAGVSVSVCVILVILSRTTSNNERVKK